MSDSEKVVPLHSVTPEGSPEKRAPRHVRSALQLRTAEDIHNEQTAEALALLIWAAVVGEIALSGMSVLFDELLQSHLLDDDDEEGDDEGWLDDHHKREKKLLDEAIADGFDKYPDINAVSLVSSADPDIARNVEQLRSVLGKCAIGAIAFKGKFPRAQLERLVKRDLKKRFKQDSKYAEHVRNEVPGSNIRIYGSRGRTSSKGAFVKVDDFESGGSMEMLLTGGWMRVAKDRIDPVALSHQFGLQRKSERQNWRHHFVITERNGNQSRFELPGKSWPGPAQPPFVRW